MKIRVNNPHVTDELRSALEAVDCVAARTADDTLEVEIPWIEADADERQAHLELAFFVRAWQASYPGLAAFVTA